MSSASPRKSNVEIIREADAYPYAPDAQETSSKTRGHVSNDVYTLTWPTGEVLGYMLPSAVSALKDVPESLRGPLTVDDSTRTLHAFTQAAEEQRTAAIDAVMRHWRAHDTFAILRGWRDERWPVYGSARHVLYSVERSATGMLGVMRYGVHMTGYVRDATVPHGLRIWVPRRAADKSTYPGMLDNTVAGGLMTGEDPFECMVREADEEAALPEAVMRERCKYTGMVTYISVTDHRAGGESGQIYPETQWVYDIELPADTTPTPKDGEVAAFYLWAVDEVQAALGRGEFKPNTALIVIDFFVRHGILTRENEPDYDEIVRRMHRKLPFPGPHQEPLPPDTGAAQALA
ncbi:NUDIX domain-containing protein [Xylariaceae sp. FL0016]|nr:NUDIX domain-containing protein [Xylariaceae sp. FL0016]